MDFGCTVSRVCHTHRFIIQAQLREVWGEKQQLPIDSSEVIRDVMKAQSCLRTVECGRKEGCNKNTGIGERGWGRIDFRK